MWISRVRVTGGFLEGLDVRLERGLNVIVGPRGAGKTTLLEILRHALALPDSDNEKTRERLIRHALGAGEVIVELASDTGAERLVVDAAGGGRRPDLTSAVALMLGQNELEEIADSPLRRLALIDRRSGMMPTRVDSTTTSDVSKLTPQIWSLTNQSQQLDEQLRQRASLLADRERLRAREHELISQSTTNELSKQRAKLAEIEAALLETQTDQESTLRISREAAQLLEATSGLEDVIRRLADLPTPVGIRTALSDELAVARQSVEALDATIRKVSAIAEESAEALRATELELRDGAEPLRTRLDQTEKGLGGVTAELRDIEAQLARLNAVQVESAAIMQEVERLRRLRAELQAAVERSAEQRYSQRLQAAHDITERLDHTVQIVVQHLAETEHFSQLLIGLLQGSGLKSTALSEAVASNVIPFALVRYVEDRDSDGLAEAAGITSERAVRLLSFLNEPHRLAAIAAVQLEDAIDFKLQDGAALKSTSQLSTGQKCAVTLPVVLTDDTRMVILDQPEDHLDNQFLVNRIVRSVATRTSLGAQTIIATHNPNFPVLGSAGQVIHLSSDGVSAAVQADGPFDATPIVRVITDLMEGGAEAFEIRAQFYSDHPRHP